jgi:hypothetical protein
MLGLVSVSVESVVRWWLLSFLLGGCQLVFDVKTSTPIDGLPTQDEDRDGARCRARIDYIVLYDTARP